MKDVDSVCPVFDATRVNSGGSLCEDYDRSGPGMTPSQYAAIHLKVPMSGDPELDKMIRESRRADFAGRVLRTITERSEYLLSNKKTWKEFLAEQSFALADALFVEWEKSMFNKEEE
jgi:hypothetical protein